MRYSLVNKYYLAKELYDSGHSEAPTMSKLDELQALADVVNGKLLEAYGRRPKSGGYAWSGLGTFKDLEAAVFEGEAWNPRGYFKLASERVRSPPNAGEPLDLSNERKVFLVGPIDGGLTGP